MPTYFRDRVLQHIAAENAEGRFPTGASIKRALEQKSHGTVARALEELRDDKRLHQYGGLAASPTGIRFLAMGEAERAAWYEKDRERRAHNRCGPVEKARFQQAGKP